MDSNCRPLVSEATALTTLPLSLPQNKGRRLRDDLIRTTKQVEGIQFQISLYSGNNDARGFI